MLFGEQIFGANTFAKATGVGFEYWNESCRESSLWSVINPTIVGIRRCTDVS